ncbi:hypothetical protein [Duganella sp. HH101]|uniref:hypothetical protein n=1 Tax=Duganella sp. HH101 TaxID=1781066 RepID=UPI00087527C1|nr:hypothetical protein [Duganella sp. HH101]OFA04854.1 hypothetical protein DUGA2_15970 [Duganella sp. HH101]
MVATMSVIVSPSTLFALMERLRETGAAIDPAEAVDAAIQHWLVTTCTAQPAAPRGYQWKTLFLPEGTWLRMAYRNDHEYAIVEGDHIMYKGRAVSPNQFASGYADSVRNAWQDISIRMPGEKHWKIADLRRRELARAAVAVPAMAAAAGLSGAPLPAAVAMPSDPSTAPAPSVPRNVTPGQGWTEPERRKFRFRLEDVAFD